MTTLEQLMKKTASYIEAVQPKLDKIDSYTEKIAEYNKKISKYEDKKVEFVKRASQAAGVLANRGIIDQSSVNEVVDRVASNPTEVWDLVEKMATAFDLGTLGDISNQKTGENTADPWEREFLGATSTRSGMID